MTFNNIRTRRKGFVLIMVMVFLILAALMSVGVYSAVYFVSKAQGIDEIRRMRGYYAAYTGLHYANVLVRGTMSYPATKSLHDDYPDIWNDLGLKGSEDVIITITERPKGGYDVTSTATF